MPDKEISIDFKVIEWWISWWREDKDHYFCAIVEVNGKMQYIERELEQT